MTDYNFGRMIYSKCFVAEVRHEILQSIKNGGGASDAIRGFVSVMRDQGEEIQTGATKKFLKDFDAALRQGVMK